MKQTRTSHSSKKPFIAGVVVFLLLLILTQYLSYQRHQINAAAEQREIANAARGVKERLRNSLQHSFAATKTLAFIVEKYGEPSDFDSVARNLLGISKYIDAIELVKGGEIVAVYPLKGNEAALGLNILQADHLKKEALKAVEQNELFFSGPFELKQGGLGVVGRQPIYKENKFWGFAAVVIKFQTLVDASGIGTPENKHFDFQISKINPNTKKEEFFLPNPGKFDEGHFEVVQVPDGEWNLYVKYHEKNGDYLSIAFVILGLLLSLLGGIFAWYFMRQPAQLIKLVDKKTEELQAVEHNYRTTMARVSDAIIAVDNNWRYTFINDAALPTHPAGREATLGQKIWDVHPDMIGTIFEEKYHEAMDTGNVLEIESFYAPMNAWFMAKVFPSADGLTVIYKDITAAKRIEAEFKAKQQQLQSIYDSASDPLFLVDVLPEGKFKIITINKAFITTTGLNEDQIVNKYIHEIIPESSLQFVLENYNKSVKTKKVVEWEETTPYPSGLKIGIVYMSPILNKEGECVQLLGVVHDITERKKAEEAMLAMNEQLRSLSGHLLNIREEERTYIAREIHDDLGQQLTGLKFVLASIRNKNDKELHSQFISDSVYEMLSMVDTAIISVRRIAKELRPGVLDDLGLEAAIEWQAKESEDRTGIKVNVSSDLNDEHFSKELNTAVFRIFQESLTNVTRHAKATRIDVRLFMESEELVLEIIDNGVGITEERKNNRSSLGLLGMNERATYLNGKFTIEKHKAGGTIVTVKIPVKK